MSIEVSALEDIIINAVADVCKGSVIGCQSEFVAQHAIMERLIKLDGFRLEVGTSKGGAKVRKQVYLEQGRVKTMDVRRLDEKRTSIDLMVTHPFEYRMELKARSTVSSSDGTAPAGIMEDIERVLNEYVDSFLLVADKSIYDMLASCAINRGRPRTHMVELYYPQVSNMGDSIYKHNGLVNRVLVLQSPSVGQMRVISLMKRENLS